VRRLWSRLSRRSDCFISVLNVCISYVGSLVIVAIVYFVLEKMPYGRLWADGTVRVPMEFQHDVRRNASPCCACAEMYFRPLAGAPTLVPIPPVTGCSPSPGHYNDARAAGPPRLRQQLLSAARQPPSRGSEFDVPASPASPIRATSPPGSPASEIRPQFFAPPPPRWYLPTSTWTSPWTTSCPSCRSCPARVPVPPRTAAINPLRHPDRRRCNWSGHGAAPDLAASRAADR